VSVATRTGARLPRLGQGTWLVGGSGPRRTDEVRALRLGLDLGLTLIDTAEMYSGAEGVVGEAIEGRRDEVYLVSKVLPQNASYPGTIEAAENSLRLLGTDRIDLYLLHWKGRHPLAETYRAFERLREQGKILDYGVSNFDVGDLDVSEATPGGAAVSVNQILLNPIRRGPERNLLPLCRERGIAVMAFSPLEQGRLSPRAPLEAVAARHGVTLEQVVLAWLLLKENVVTIVKSSREDHVRANAAARDLELTPEDLADIDVAYPVPDHDVPLEWL
jgi:diketogulonate reductase-like aldo/keto reductase